MPDWWHCIELTDGSVTDGFWAFELERRGAASVLATDTSSYFQSPTRSGRSRPCAA